jgi:hypothetical protein
MIFGQETKPLHFGKWQFPWGNVRSGASQEQGIQTPQSANELLDNSESALVGTETVSGRVKCSRNVLTRSLLL